MSVKKIPMTKIGMQQLREELHRLKTVERPRVIQAIAEARALGDLKENAEYQEAKRQQGFIEGRIVELEYKLAHAQVIETATMSNNGKIIFGTTVSLLNMETSDEVTYYIVGEDEADIKVGKISITSPIARALIGKVEGDIAVVQTPTGSVEYEITKVEYL